MLESINILGVLLLVLLVVGIRCLLSKRAGHDGRALLAGILFGPAASRWFEKPAPDAKSQPDGDDDTDEKAQP